MDLTETTLRMGQKIILSVTFYRDGKQTSGYHRGERQGSQIGVGD